MQSGKRPNSSSQPSGAAGRQTASSPYRSRVHSLLGMPDVSDVDPKVRPAVLPVDFQYRSEAPEPSEIDQVGQKPADEAATYQREQKQPTRPVKPPRPAAPSMMESHVENLLDSTAKHLSKQENIQPEDSQQLPVVKPEAKLETEKQPEPVEQSDSHHEQIEIEVPGVSSKQLSFPTVSQGKKEANVVDVPTDDEAPKTTSPDYAWPSQVNPEPEKPQTKEEPDQTARFPQRTSAPQLDEERPAPISQTMRALAQAQIEEKPVGSDGQSEMSLPMPRQPERLPERKQPESPMVDPDVMARSQRETAVILNQLQRAVQQLTAKTASPPPPEPASRQAEPEPPPSASPPVQQIVVLNRSVNRPGAPRAFWERSYLGRSRFIVRR
ncbi:MAG: hypothetical protein GY803_30025 [Chloroflexi bacterium]|nr:hypothetical protein [Chloroflexota bacterium]